MKDTKSCMICNAVFLPSVQAEFRRDMLDRDGGFFHFPFA